MAAQVDKNGNIISDPSNGQTYAWDPRNHLETASGVNGKNSPILYDNKGRREDLPNSSGERQYSYDGNQVIQTNGTATTNYLRMPGGRMLMASPSGSDAEILLIAGSGSTIAMVDASTGAISSQYTYNPLGAVTVSGTGYQTIYQYLGMENDGFAYYGGGRYYSPVMGRMLSLQRPLSSSGGYGSGVAPIASAMGAAPSGGGGNGGVQDGLQAFGDAAQALAAAHAAAGAAVASSAMLSDSAFATFAASTAWAPYVAGVAEAVYQVLNFFGVFGGGSSGPPAWMVWRLNHQGGNLQQWAQINGVDPTLAPSWQPAGGIKLIKDATKKAQRPLKKTHQPYLLPVSVAEPWPKGIKKPNFGGAVPPYNGPTMLSCFFGRVGYDPEPIIGCVGGIALSDTGAGVVSAVVSCPALAAQAAACRNYPAAW